MVCVCVVHSEVVIGKGDNDMWEEGFKVSLTKSVECNDRDDFNEGTD